MPRSLDAELA
ncbi:hypothetical protein A2U01_0079217, partial [Trifolium medium]|nr:hypothetical protein [Trifolium medium]